MSRLISCRHLVQTLLTACILNFITLFLFCWTQEKPELSSVRRKKMAERRNVIRQTWMTQFQINTVKVNFVLGSHGLSDDIHTRIRKEQDRYKDILLLDEFEDSYFRLTQKLLSTLYAVYRSGDKGDFIMKCDDDTFIDSKRLMEKVKSYPENKAYVGYLTGAAHVKKAGQWAEPNFHLCDRYLPYARGGGYIITWDLLEYIVGNKEILQVYNSEDVAMGVWLAPLDIQRIHDVSFDTEARSRGCQNHHIVSHKQSVDEMKAKHTSLLTQNKLCDKEIKLAREYEYNWLVPPSQCCPK